MNKKCDRGIRWPAFASRRRDGGFTLVEMMVVIVIIGILATVVIVNVSGHADKAKVNATQAILKTVGNQIEIFKLNHNRYPDNVNDLFMQPSYVEPRSWPPGGYVTEPPVDGWGRPFMYRVPGSNGSPFDLYSLGEDGKEGGEGPAADIWFRKQVR
jgi:general secretion pathway protein G